MDRVREFAILVSCFLTSLTTGVLSDPYAEFRDRAINCGIASDAIDQNRSNVYINHKPYEIYVFDFMLDKPINTYTIFLESDNSNDDDDDDAFTNNEVKRSFYNNTVYKLYVCVNCQFARWTLDELVELLEPFPSLYHRKFQATHNYTYVTFCEQSAAAFTNIVRHAEKFVNILMNFQNVFLSKRDTSVDTDNLQSLLELMFKIRFLRARCDESTIIEYSDVKIVRLILGLINSIQNYVFTNCEMPTENDLKQLYGFFVGADKIDIEEFLADIGPLRLEPSAGCRVQQMLLIDGDSWRFDHVKWRTTHGETTVKNVVRRLNQSHEQPVIFWYQDRMFETIIKTLFSKIKVHFERNRRYLSDDSVTDLKTIHSMFSDHMSLPSDLNECFLLVTSNTDDEPIADHHELVAKITAFVNSLSSIDLGKDASTMIHDPENDGFESVSDSSDGPSVLTAEEFIAHMKSSIEDLKCFMKLFQYFRYKNDITYYMPFANTSKQIQSFEREISLNKTSKNRSIFTTDNRDNKIVGNVQSNYDVLENDGCKFYGGLYHICFLIAVDLNLVYSAEHYTDYLGMRDLDIFSRIDKNIATITDILNSFTNNYSYHPHFRTILSILPLIVFKNSYFFSEDYSIDLKRTVYVIMNELNNYSIEYCNPPKHNFLFFNNINFPSIGLISIVQEEIVSSLNQIKNTNGIYYPEYTFKSSKDLFFAITNHSSFDLYDDIIVMNWKGWKLNTRLIFITLTSSTVSAFDLFAFHDYSLKFCFAVIYIELYIIFYEIQNSATNNQTQRMFLNFFDEHKFPKKFENVVYEIKIYISNHVSSLSTDTNNTYEIEIKKAFDNIGVHFENMDKIRTLNVNISKDRLFMIMDKLKIVNGEFWKMSYK